jgi:hypothetical protein
MDQIDLPKAPTYHVDLVTCLGYFPSVNLVILEFYGIAGMLNYKLKFVRQRENKRECQRNPTKV